MPMWIEGLMRSRVLRAPADAGTGSGSVGGAAGGGEGGAAAGTLLGGGAAGAPGGDAGGGAADPRSWLPEEYRADPTFKDLADPAALAKSYKHAAGLVGADRAQLLQLPKDGPDDKWDGWGRLGRPDKPEDYKIETPPAGVPEAALGTFRQRMFAAGASQKQVSEALAVYGEVAAAQQAELDKSGLGADRQKALFGAVVATEAAQAQLKQNWGAAYDAKLASAARAVRETGGDALMRLLDSTGLGNNPVLLDAFAKVGERIAEPSGLKGGGGAVMGGPLTPDAARAEISKLSADKTFFAAMGDAGNPGHAEAMRRWNELHSFAYGAAG